MSDISFEVCLTKKDAEDFQAVLREHGLTVTSQSPDIQKSITPTEAIVYVSICGAVVSVARAFEAYFKSKDKVLQIMSGDELLYIKNFSAKDVEKISKARSVAITDRRP